MVSTSEEFVLLLKKWQSEETNIAVVGYMSEADGSSKSFLLIHGRVRNMDEQKSQFVVGDDHLNMAFVTFTDCDFVYEVEDLSSPGVSGLKFLSGGEEYEELALLITPIGFKLALYSQKAATED